MTRAATPTVAAAGDGVNLKVIRDKNGYIEMPAETAVQEFERFVN